MTEQEFRIQLLVFKHKMKNLVWTSGISALDGEFQSASEVDFYIDKVERVDATRAPRKDDIRHAAHTSAFPSHRT